MILALCFLVAALEGLDIQAMGVVAPKLAPLLHLAPAQMGVALSASIVGLLFGAGIGGWASDEFGRKRLLMISTGLFGLMSIATTFAVGFWGLVWLRFLTGLGLGGAFPTLIAISSDNAAPNFRATAVSLMYCGLPVGGALASAIGAFGARDLDWRVLFYIGGFAPLLLVPLLAMFLPRGAPTAAAADQVDRSAALFGEDRAGATVRLWLGYFFTLLVVYLLVNWLPSLLVKKGFTRIDGAMAALCLNFGAVLGSITFGRMIDRGHRNVTLVLIYTGMALSLASLAYGVGFHVLLVAAFFAGLFAIGGQLVLYALAPGYYPLIARGTGIGAAVAAGRAGSIVGPIVAGVLLGSGGGAALVLLTAIPGLVVAAVATLSLPVRRTI